MNTKLIKKSFRNTGKALRYHRKHILVSILAMVMLLGVICFCGSDNKVEYKESASGAKKSIDLEGYAGFFMLPFSMLDDLAGASDVEAIADMLNVTYDNGRTGVAAIISSPSDSDVIRIGSRYSMTKLSPLLRQANGLAVVLATWLLVITWGTGFMNQEFKGAQLEELAKRFLLLAIGFIGVFIAMNLSFFVMNLGSSIATELADATETALSTDSVEDTVLVIKGQMVAKAKKTNGNVWENIGPFFKNIGNCLGYIGQFFIPWLINKVALILIKFTAWSRVFELIILAVFSPFAFADVVDMHRIGMGTGSRYLKNIGSIALSGAVIVLVVALGKLIQIEMLQTFNSGISIAEASATLGDMALVALATGGLCLKAPQLSKSVLGLG